MNGDWKSRNFDTRTIVDLLQVRAGDDPDRVAYRFLTDGEVESARVTYAGQTQFAKAIAAMLQEKNAFGERALLLYPPALDFISAFLGCLYAGVIAVPAYPPRGNRSLPRLMAIAEDAKPKLILTTSSLLPTIQNWVVRSFGGRDDIEVIATDKIQPDAGEQWQRPNITDETVAFLQYTSGSTSSPKGVIVSHANLVHNEEMIRRAFSQSESSIIVSWLPLYHDMGLIGGVLQPLYLGAQCILMSPLAFVQKPLRWLKAISSYRATTSGGPNFAYELCIRKVREEQRAGLDLSTWTVAFNGAEPVRAETLERFAQTFASSGFRRQAFYPCYGLAEATLFVTGGSVEAEPNICALQSSELQQGRAVETKAESEGQKLVGCGQSKMEQQVVIVDPEMQVMCASGQVGEIWISGPSIAQGYWNRPEETARDFRVELLEKDVRFLRTGDLGFLLNGELFVTGRLKDLIIVRGRNFYPQDIEQTAENSHPSLLPGCGAAFFVEAEGEERVVLVQEIGTGGEAIELEKVAEGIRSAVAQEHELSVYDVVLIRRGTIRKTSSGKIQRHACKEQYLKDELQVVARRRAEQIDPANLSVSDEILDPAKLLTLEIGERQQAIQEYVTGLVAQTLRISRKTLQPEQALSSLGLDSMEAIELKHALEVRLNVSVSLAFLLEAATTNDLINKITEGLEKSPVIEASLLRSGTDVSEFPLSYGQRGLWFAQQLTAESSAYNLAMAARVSGPLDTGALQRALQGLLDRHPALRTSFYQGEDGQPRQRVHHSVTFAVEVIAAEHLTEDSLKRQLSEKASQPFDLLEAPLLKVAVFQRSAGEHALLMTMHHIAGDFWSFTVAFDELIRFYFQETGSGPAQLPDLELRYSDYVKHQSEHLNSKRGEELWAYWHSVLHPPLLNLDLHTDQPRPALQTYRGGSRNSVIDPRLAQSLREFSRSAGVTLYTVLLGAFQALLHRYTGQEDIAVGSPVTGRGNPQFANVVGFFTNPLVLRSQIPGHISFRDFLGEVRRTVLGALDHQDYPFALIVERLQPARDPSRSPLFQAMFILQQAQRKELKELSALALGDPATTLTVGPLTLQGFDLPEKETPFDVTLMVTESTSGLLASLQYNRDLFHSATAERMLGHFQTMLSGIAANPDQPVELLPFLSPAEQEQLRCWNATQADYPAECLIFELFERQVKRTPNAIAVEGAMCAFTYRELHDRTSRLANYLRKSGVGPEVIVGVCLDRSADVAIALLGILKAGGAYLPIDPALPESRIAFMLEDSRTPLVLGQGAFRKYFHNYSGRFLALDTDWEKISAESLECSQPNTSSANLAYLIYTSGSTGRPKGVQIHHKAVVNFLTSMAQKPGLDASDVLVSVTTMSFDIFGLELYLPLTVGARVVLASREVAMDGCALLDLLKRSGATVMQATPATWQLLLTTPKAEFPRMRAFCGGDILSVDIVRELLARGCPVWNLYGPTETTIWSTVHQAGANDDPASWTLIGRPIAQTQIYIMDSNLQPVPVGVPGELIIGGDGVARGYWERAALTAEKFVPDPLSETSGARMYRTGDLACQRPDGTTKFLGRLDNQVKIRGFRIELQEIESALSGYPGVQQAVVAAQNDGSNDRHLVAYIVREADAPATAFAPAELRRFLSQRLPEAFVPSRFVQLQSLPLTPNGKVDRKALPGLDSGVSATVGYKAPSSELERTVAGIWKQVLKVDKLGTNDNFFDLGGHSLLLAQVNHKLRDLGYQVSMLDLFRSPTIASLAQHLSSGTSESKSVLTGTYAAQSRNRARESGKSHDIAIIGMAGRFPKAGSVKEFWNKIAQGEECISRFTDEELQKSGAARSILADPAHVKAGGVLDGEDLFDAGFFGFNPREAELMDPQQRLFLECAWHALEDAGYSSDQYEGRTGVFAGAGLNTYLYEAAPALSQSSSLRYQAFIGNDKDFLATRVSYKLNLKGPSVAVQTACSTSLVAVHLACQSLLSGECDMALAGAVSVRIPQREGYIYETGGILSPDGHCRAFDKNAEGTVFGSGMGVIVLKPLETALSDNDTIYAVIKGSAINNDGARKIGYTAPSVEG
ncbi:MAG TPA: amino acid adenylation domain-containing protein, partial [Candidatus Solibacter sp.]|nr:amino acid adenylation domain-containing protein [Candidatus Solibacter sp.]